MSRLVYTYVVQHIHTHTYIHMCFLPLWIHMYTSTKMPVPKNKHSNQHRETPTYTHTNTNANTTHTMQFIVCIYAFSLCVVWMMRKPLFANGTQNCYIEMRVRCLHKGWIGSCTGMYWHLYWHLYWNWYIARVLPAQ